MIFRAEDYRDAAAEHMTVAHDLYQHGHYVLMFYVAGLAVECMLRAYRLRIDREFDERHDLRELLTSSRFIHNLEESERTQIMAAVDHVRRLWRNSHRYCSSGLLRRFLKSGGYDRGIRGDAIKENARRLLLSATRVVEVGGNQWKS